MIRKIVNFLLVIWVGYFIYFIYKAINDLFIHRGTLNWWITLIALVLLVIGGVLIIIGKLLKWWHQQRAK